MCNLLKANMYGIGFHGNTIKESPSPTSDFGLGVINVKACSYYGESLTYDRLFNHNSKFQCLGKSDLQLICKVMIVAHPTSPCQFGYLLTDSHLQQSQCLAAK